MISQLQLPNVRRIDLNLLKVFDAMMRHGSVVEAARELHLSPSAISHSLSRLREVLADPLFVQTGTRMAPTKRAEALVVSVRYALERIEAAVEPQNFIPDKSSRTFRIAASEYMSELLYPKLLSIAERAAPNVTFQMFPANRTDAIQNLDQGNVDIMVGWFGTVPKRFKRTYLWSDCEAVVVRPDHHLTSGQVTVERLLEYGHAVLEMTGGNDIDEQGYIEENGANRRVWVARLLIEMRADGEMRLSTPRVLTPFHSNIIPIVAATDLVGTLPARYAKPWVERGALAQLQLPYPPVVADLDAIWHKARDRDPGLQWLVSTCLEATKPFRDDPPKV